MESLLPLLLIFAVMMLPMLFLSNRQKKNQQKQRELVGQLGVGDEVRTHSGFYGLIVEAFDDFVILESEDGAQTKWARQAIAMAAETTDSTEDESLESGDEVADDRTADDALESEATEQTAELEGDRDRGVIPGVTVTDDSVPDNARRDR